MNLSKISNAELADRLKKLVHSERKITHIILLHILEIESRRIYAEAGYDSMLSYLIKFFGYSEASAYRRIQAARLLKTIPAAAGKLENGALNLSQLTQVQKCLKTAVDMKQTKIEPNSEGKTKSYPKSASDIAIILNKIENRNTFETNKILAFEFDQPIQTSQIIKPQKDESVRIEITLTKEQFENLQKSKSLLSHAVPNSSWNEVIDYLAKKFNKSIQGKEDLITQSHTATKVKTSNTNKSQTRSYISIQTKRKLMKKANHSCEYINKTTQNKCGSKYQLQIDHIHPVAAGGLGNFENLQILCRTHNQLKGSITAI